MTGRQALLLSNAVNTSLFDPLKSYPRPPDMPLADWSIIYTGALWGEWFDWDLLVKIAERYPQAALVVIGDYRGQLPDPPPNLRFLGLKAHTQLPAYLAHASVAINPWKVSPITQATSPLKVYEYLAMRKPVVCPDLRPLQGLSGVFPAPDPLAFIEIVGQARSAILPEDELARFILQNSWQARAELLLEKCSLSSQTRQYSAPADR